VTLLDLVQAAGLHQVPGRPLRDACVLLPGHLVPALLERALDLRLLATYQQARLDPLFDADQAARFCYGVRLAAEPALPVSLLVALQDDPFALVCRVVDGTVLIGHGTASPLSDRALARMAAVADADAWLLAAAPGGCARVTWLGEPLDAASLVRLGPAHELADVDGTQAYAEPASRLVVPQPRPVRLVTARRGSVNVDAVLLDDGDLASLPLLLAGEPLADIAFLVRGTSRHLLTAPAGLLTELAVGEPLTCIGPGSIYLPVGYQLDPPVGPRARATLFQPDDSTAQVMLGDARLSFDLDAREPAWRLWAGPLPAMDPQLPRSALADLEQVAREVDEQPRPGEPRRQLRLPGFLRPGTVDQGPSSWREEAYRAERERDYVAAAQLYARNNEPLRAARMWEREAEEKD
jgi:hypothetical protein